jgi:hypothetical protein
MNVWKSGRASEVDKTDLCHLKSYANRRISVSLFKKMFGSSCGSVYLIINNNIKYRKGYALWGPAYLLHECCVGNDEQLEMLLLDDGVQIPVGARYFSLLQHIKICFRAHPASFSVGTRAISCG